MKRLLVATHNSGKLREYADLLAGVDFALVSLADLHIDDHIPETGSTIAENARLKAFGYARLSGLTTLSDDSGLEVDALQGAPGIHTARFGGPGLSQAQRWRLLLEQMREVPPERRTARFRCVVAIAQPTGEVQAFDGTLEGAIALKPAGAGGFGYDPVFYLPDRGRTLAELPEAEKNRLSHRARAGLAAAPYLRTMLSPSGDDQSGDTK